MDVIRPGQIRCVTFVADDLAACEAAWCGHLAHRRVASGRVDAATAAGWQAPATAGRDYLLLEPAAAPGHYLRFVDGPVPADYVPFSTTGWNAAEILVRDCDALAARLADSPWRIIGPPQDLSFTDSIRAMQVQGPSGQLLYLTQIKGPVPGFDLRMASAEVESCFVGILGGQDFSAMKHWYRARFGLADAADVPSRVTGLSRALGESLEARYTITALTLAGGCLVEIDAFPPATGLRPCGPGELPPAMAILGIETPGPLPAGAAVYASPLGAESAPAICLQGAAGERVEILGAP